MLSNIPTRAMFIPANMRASIVPSFCDLAKLQYALPALLNSRSTPADVAGQPKNCRAIRATFGYFLDPVSLHHTNRSSPKSEICETSLMYRSASVLGPLATRAAGEAAALASLPIRSASPTLRLFVGRGPVSGVTDADATTGGSSTTPVLAGSQFAKYSLLKALMAYDFNLASKPSKSRSLKQGLPHSKRTCIHLGDLS